MKRFWLAVSVAIVALAMSGVAQQSGVLKVKPSPPEKPAKPNVPVEKTGPASASSANARNLAAIEHQTAKASASPRTSGKKTPGALKPVKDKPNAPINFGATGAGKKPGTTTQGASSYNGRLKQKGGGVHQ
jgi:hypothetical protein